MKIQRQDRATLLKTYIRSLFSLMKFKYTALVCFLTLLTFAAPAQSRLIKKLLSNEPDTSRSPSFMPLPAVGYAQETGFEFGVITLYSFYTDKSDTIVRSSSINGLATLTTKKQASFYIKSDLWLKQNKLHLTGEIRYKDFPFNFYGIGSQTSKTDEDKLNQKLFRIAAEAEKLIRKNYYTGVNLNYENYTFSDKEEGGIYTTDPLIWDKDGGKAFFMGISQIYDTRNTNIYTTKGTYIKANYSYAPDFFGGESFTGSLFEFDFRTFKSLGAKSVAGFNLIYNTLQGSQAPFYLLPRLGNDQQMRGYYTGRYRDKNLLAAQFEIRHRFIPRLGMAAFGGAGDVYPNGGFTLNNFKPSYGAGLRYFFDVERGLSVRFDYGIGEKRPGEKRQTGFYISFGEAF